MEQLNARGLRSVLEQRGLARDICLKLEEELIDGESFLKLDGSLLRTLNFKGLEIIKITKIQSNLLDEPIEESSSINDKNDENDKENCRPDKADSNDIRKYFSETEYLDLSDYERKNLTTQFNRYTFAISSGQSGASIIKPDFVKKYEQAQEVRGQKRKRNNLKTAETPCFTTTRRMAQAALLAKANSPSGSCQQLSARASDEASCSPQQPSPQPVGPSTSDVASGGVCSSLSPQQLTPQSMGPSVSGVSSGGVRSCAYQRPTPQSVGPSTSDVASGGVCSSWSPQRLTPQSMGPSVSGVSSGGVRSCAYQRPTPQSVGPSVSGVSSGGVRSCAYQRPTPQSVGPSVSGVASGGATARPAATSRESACWSETRLQEIISLKPHLPTFDLGSIVEQLSTTQKGKQLHKKIVSGSSLTEPERKELVRHLTKWLYHTHAESPNQVTTEMREGLAKSILIKWPSFSSYDLPVVADINLTPWSHIYNVKSNTGWIANAARPIQAKNRSRKSKESQAQNSDHEDSSEMMGSNEIEQLALTFPGRRQKAEIMEGMKASFKNREKDRLQGKSITHIVQTYPHFASYGGELISEEFYRLKPNAQDMCKLFRTLQPQILILPERRPISLLFQDDTMMALTLIAQHLPHDIPAKDDGDVTQSWAEEEDLFVVKQTSDNLSDYVIERRAASSRPVQPYLIVIQSSVTKKVLKTFIVLDEKVAEISVESPLKALDFLIQSYFVFNVKYPFGWRNCLTFIALCLYKVAETGQRSKGCRPCDLALWKKISK